MNSSTLAFPANLADCPQVQDTAFVSRFWVALTFQLLRTTVCARETVDSEVRTRGVAEPFKPANPRSPHPPNSVSSWQMPHGFARTPGSWLPSSHLRGTRTSRGGHFFPGGGKDEVGKTELGRQQSAETHPERRSSARRGRKAAPRERGGPARALAFPVTGAALAAPSPAAAGPFPESLKRREGWGAALPQAQRAGGWRGRKGGGTGGRSRAGKFCRGCGSKVPRRNWTNTGQSSPSRLGRPAARRALEHPPSPRSRRGSAREAGVFPPVCCSPGALGTCR